MWADTKLCVWQEAACCVEKHDLIAIRGGNFNYINRGKSVARHTHTVVARCEMQLIWHKIWDRDRCTQRIESETLDARCNAGRQLIFAENDNINWDRHLLVRQSQSQRQTHCAFTGKSRNTNLMVSKRQRRYLQTIIASRWKEQCAKP